MNGPCYPLRCGYDRPTRYPSWRHWQCSAAATHHSPALGHYVCEAHAGFTCRLINGDDMHRVGRLLSGEGPP